MTVDEIFRDISAHMIRGVMFHEQMADYYDFLNLHGYKRCHEYHMYCEMKSFRKLHRYFLNHFNKLIEESVTENPDAIPSSWYRYSRQDVDANTKRNAVKAGIDKWVSWESETKEFYNRMYTELMSLGETTAAKKVCMFLYDVDHELKCAQRKQIDLMTVDYSLSYVVGEQKRLHDCYQKKMRGKHDKHRADKR